MPNPHDKRDLDVERILELGNIAIWHGHSKPGLLVEILAMDEDCLGPLMDEDGEPRIIGSGPSVDAAIRTALANNLDDD